MPQSTIDGLVNQYLQRTISERTPFNKLTIHCFLEVCQQRRWPVLGCSQPSCGLSWSVALHTMLYSIPMELSCVNLACDPHDVAYDNLTRSNIYSLINHVCCAGFPVGGHCDILFHGKLCLAVGCRISLSLIKHLCQVYAVWDNPTKPAKAEWLDESSIFNSSGFFGKWFLVVRILMVLVSFWDGHNRDCQHCNDSHQMDYVIFFTPDPQPGCHNVLLLTCIPSIDRAWQPTCMHLSFRVSCVCDWIAK